jgi:uncharacterized protein (TIGR02996 family)
MTDLDALTAACLDDPDDEARLGVLADWLEERGDARADALRGVLRWRALVSAARPEEVPDDCEDPAALLLNTAEALGPPDARLWASACLRRLPLLEGGAGPALLADHRRRCVVAAVELFACGLLGADGLRSARAGLGLGDDVSRREAEADPGRVVVWALAEPDVGRSYRELLGAAVLFLGTGGDRFRRATLLTRRAVAAADRALRERRRGPDGRGEG